MMHGPRNMSNHTPSVENSRVLPASDQIFQGVLVSDTCERWGSDSDELGFGFG